MSDSVGLVETGRRNRIVTIAAAWRSATSNTSFIPMPQGEVRERFEQMAAEALDALRAGEPPEAALEGGRSIGRQLVGLNLLKPVALEATLACLGHELAGVGSPEKMGHLLAGIAGGFAAATEAALLAQQEAVNQASTLALRQAQRELETSRDRLTAANRELSDQIAERTRAEAIQRSLAERLQRLHQIDLAILSADSLTAIMDILLGQLSTAIPSVSISLVSVDLDTSRSTILRSTNDVYPAGRELPITMARELARLARGEVIYIPDLQTIRNYSPGVTEIADMGGRSVLAFPLLYGDDLIGGLVVILGEVRRLTTAEESMVHELADSVAVAIQNRRLLEAEQAIRRRETTLRQVAAALTLGLSQDDLLHLVLEQLELLVPTYSSAIMLLDQSGNPVLVYERGEPKRSEIIDDLIIKRPRTLWTVLETGQPFVINDTHLSPDWMIIEGFEAIRAWMGVPLLVMGQCIGILTIDRDHPKAFTEEDKDLAMAFANQAAIAIDNARLFARVQAHAGELEQAVHERTRELEVLYGITTAAVSNPDMETLLQRAMELTVDAFGCVAASVHLIEGEEVGLQVAALLETAEHATLAAHLRTLDADSPCLLQPLQSGRPMIMTADGLPVEWAVKEETTLVSVPLRSRGRNQGVLCLLCEKASGSTGAAPELLMTIADQIGAAVENIKLYLMARHSAKIEERERLAREIHDQVTQSIYSAALFAEAARGAAGTEDHEKLDRHIDSIQRMTNQALRELRLLIFENRSEALARKGLVDALSERLKTVENRAGIAGEVHAAGVDLIPLDVEETFYRIANEALNNALRHARADRVDIIVLVEEGHLVMTIVDNGIGFDWESATVSGGMGLEGMQKRIGKVNGALTVSSNEEGTWVTARAPLEVVTT